MQQASSALFSLGGAIWGFTPAAGYASPQHQGVPEAWLLVLIEEHADAEFFLCLFRASRGARDWVLVTAPQAQCWRHSGRGACGRQRRTGGVSVCIDNSIFSTLNNNVATFLLLVAFQWSGYGIRQLSLQWEGRDAPKRGTDWSKLWDWDEEDLMRAAVAWCRALLAASSIRTALRDTAARGLSQLSSLSAKLVSAGVERLLELSVLRQYQVAIPPPPHMPQLRELSVTNLAPNDATCGTIAQHLSQLTSLSIQDDSGVPGSKIHRSIFTPATPSTTLVKFSISTPLYDELLSLLLDRTPLLQDLTVGEVRVQSNRHRNRQWAVHVLRLQCDVNDQSLSYLPSSPELLITTSATTPCFVVMHGHYQGLSTEVRERLKTWRFEHYNFKIRPWYILDSSDHPLALQATLQQLHTASPTPLIPGSCVQLSYWHAHPSSSPSHTLVGYI